jgi:hypothetical protein
MATRESEHQIALFQWRENEVRCGRHDLLTLLFIPNGGGFVTEKIIFHGRKFGYLCGVPDLFWPVPRGGFHGLFIELKSLHGAARPERSQLWCHKLLRANDYAVAVCHGHGDAIEEINRYDGLGKS